MSGRPQALILEHEYSPVTATTLQLVIPTLWNPARLMTALEDYLHCPVVERVIVIDNDPGNQPAAVRRLAHHPRLLLLHQDENLYVNPSWNLGMAQISGHRTLVGLLNDDIQIPCPVLARLLAQAPPCGTVVGLLPAEESARNCVSDSTLPEDALFALEPFPYRQDLSIGTQCSGFGSALFLRRGDYVPVPVSLKIWFGDDWLLRHADQVLGLRSPLIRMDRHVTMSALRRSPAFRERLAQDKREAGTLLGWNQSSGGLPSATQRSNERS